MNVKDAIKALMEMSGTHLFLLFFGFSLLIAPGVLIVCTFSGDLIKELNTVSFVLFSISVSFPATMINTALIGVAHPDPIEWLEPKGREFVGILFIGGGVTSLFFFIVVILEVLTSVGPKVACVVYIVLVALLALYTGLRCHRNQDK